MVSKSEFWISILLLTSFAIFCMLLPPLVQGYEEQNKIWGLQLLICCVLNGLSSHISCSMWCFGARKPGPDLWTSISVCGKSRPCMLQFLHYYLRKSSSSFSESKKLHKNKRWNRELVPIYTINTHTNTQLTINIDAQKPITYTVPITVSLKCTYTVTRVCQTQKCAGQTWADKGLTCMWLV